MGLLVVLLAAAAPVLAQESEGPSAAVEADTALELDEAVRTAVDSYPGVVATRAGADEAEAAVEAAEAARRPTVEVNATAIHFEEPMLVSPLHALDPEQAKFDRTLLQGEIVGRYLLFNGGARGARIRRESALAAAARANVDSAVAALSERTARSYLRVLTEREAVFARDEQVEALAAELERAREFFEAGRAARVEILRAEAELASARADRSASVRQLDLAERDLARLTGLPPARTQAERIVGGCRVTLPVSGERDVLVGRATELDPAVREAQLELRAARAELDARRAARWPEVYLAAEYDQYGSLGGGFTGEWQIGVIVSWDVYTGGERGAEIDRAEARVRQAQAGLRLTRLETVAAVDSALATLRDARDRHEALTAAVVQFGEVARIERVGLDVGRGTQTDYLGALARLALTRADAAAAREAIVAARIELARAVGVLSPAWVASNVECGG